MKAICDYCGIEFEKKEKLRAHNFCCRAHLDLWNRQRMSVFNQTENPLNCTDGWTAARRSESRRRNLGKGENRAYKKVYGKHAHRVVAEMILGRELLPDEVVHHKNGDKTDNRPENIEVMTRAEHSRRHMREYWARRREGGDEKNVSEK